MVNYKRSLMESDEKLQQELKEYNWLLSKAAYEYLEALLHLETSAFNPKFSDYNREILKRIDLYKRIAIYNICNRTKMLLANNTDGIKVKAVERFDDHPVEFIIFANTHGKSLDCFRFNISEDDPLYVGDAIIHSSNIDENLRNSEMERLIKEYEEKQKQDNPHARHDGVARLQDENGSFWEAIRKSELDNIHRQYDRLANFKPDDLTISEIEAQNYLASLILNDMNLQETDFTDINQNGMKKTLVRRYPNMSIRQDIKSL